MTQLRALCVYCGSSNSAVRAHLDLAAELGRLAARRGVEVVFGGGHVGLMGALADGALAAGGRIVGVIPQHLEAREVSHRGVSDLLVVDSMHTRKRRMFELSDAFCVLPGGLGTLDEAFEIITWRQLGLHDKPIVLVNYAGFWDPLLRLFERQVEAGYLWPRHMELLRVVGGVQEVFEAVLAEPAPALPGETELL